MNRKLGRVMSNSRMVSFIAFLSATCAWIMKMPILFLVTAVALIASALLHLHDRRHTKQ